MHYYRVVKGDVLDKRTGAYTIKNELFTKTEKAILFPTLKENVFEEVDINRKHTYFFFGARFEFGTERGWTHEQVYS